MVYLYNYKNLFHRHTNYILLIRKITILRKFCETLCVCVCVCVCVRARERASEKKRVWGCECVRGCV